MKDKIIEILEQYRYTGENDLGPSIPKLWFKNLAKEIDSLYPTLNRDKVMEVLNNNSQKSVIGNAVEEADFKYVTDALCSLSLPTLSEEEIHEKAVEYSKEVNKRFGGIYSVRERSFMINGYEAALKELTKPKE
jgi:predicted house-cleaning noncanonical NTP pyrophosphatase (MazG superfamily)